MPTGVAGIGLGMGMPTTPAYIVMTSLLVPAVAKEATRAKNLSPKFASNENFVDTTPVASWIAAEALDE